MLLGWELLITKWLLQFEVMELIGEAVVQWMEAVVQWVEAVVQWSSALVYEPRVPGSNPHYTLTTFHSLISPSSGQRLSKLLPYCPQTGLTTFICI